jgi:hypothetical protein
MVQHSPEVVITHRFHDAETQPAAFDRYAEIMAQWREAHPKAKVRLLAATVYGGEVHWRFGFQNWDAARAFDAMFDKES